LCVNTTFQNTTNVFMILEDDSYFDISEEELTKYINKSMDFKYDIIKMSTSLFGKTNEDYKIRPVDIPNNPSESIVYDCSLNFGTFSYIASNPFILATRLDETRLDKIKKLKESIEKDIPVRPSEIFYQPIDSEFVRMGLRMCTYKQQIVYEVGTYSTIACKEMDYSNALCSGSFHYNRL